MVRNILTIIRFSKFQCVFDSKIDFLVWVVILRCHAQTRIGTFAAYPGGGNSGWEKIKADSEGDQCFTVYFLHWKLFLILTSRLRMASSVFSRGCWNGASKISRFSTFTGLPEF